MILVGQHDSPFVRRVGIALVLYGMAFEHRPWSVFGDGERLQALNPLMRVPVLVLDDGYVLTGSHMMLDYLDALVPEDAALFPRAEPSRRVALKRAALATGLPGAVDLAACPALRDHCARLEATEPFLRVFQPFIVAA